MAEQMGRVAAATLAAAVAHVQRDDLRAAVPVLRRVLAERTGEWQAALLLLGRIANLAPTLVDWPTTRRALLCLPDRPELYLRPIEHLRRLGRRGSAVRAARLAACLSPDDDAVLANCCLERGAAGEGWQAVDQLRRALVLAPGTAVAWLDMTQKVFGLCAVPELEANSIRSVLSAPSSPETHYQRARALYGQARFRDAIAAAGLAEELMRRRDGRAFHSATFLRGVCELSIGELETGFRDYEARYGMAHGPLKRTFPQPPWPGRSSPDARVLVYGEQGVADEIMFSWYLAHLQRSCAFVRLECDRRLVSMFARSYPGLDVVPRILPDQPACLDPVLTHKIPIGHLPRLFWRETAASIAALRAQPATIGARQRPRLLPRADLLESARVRLAALARPTVAFAWKGSPRGWERARRFPPMMELFSALPPGVVLVNLQDGATDDEIAALRGAAAERDSLVLDNADLDLRDDLEQVAALLAACDLLLSPASLVSWIAAAVGTPVRPVSTAPAGRSWRMLGTGFLPWGPSQRPFFRDYFDEDWSAALEPLRADLVQSLSPAGRPNATEMDS